MTDDLTDNDAIPQAVVDALTPRAGLDAWTATVPVKPEDPANATAPIALTVGRRPLQAPGARAPRRAADVAGLDAGQRANWLLTGPRNVGGRTRTLAIHPANPSVMYAGLAAGGVWKTTDRGETWAPSWRDDASSSIAGISICRDHPATVWVATGEHLSQILGTGVYVSTDDGATWGPNNVQVPGAGRAVTFDAIAAHPTNAQSCWAVGATGVYRTTDGGTTWDAFENGVPYSDVAFAAGTGGPVVFLVRARSTLGEATVLRIDNPDAAVAAVQASIVNAASASNPIPAAVAPPGPGAPLATWPGRGKIAVCAGTPTVAYVRFALQGGDSNGGGHAGLFRTHAAPHDAQAATGSAIQWDTIAAAGAADFQGEFVGGYALALGVNPANAAEIATAMSNVHISRNATAGAPTFKRVMAQELFPVVDSAQHADNHLTIFGPPPVGSPAGTPPTLWVAHDGGIVRSDDWATGAGYPNGFTFLPLPDGVVSWRKTYGITGSQMYSLSQSPVLPTAFGCGFQDNGVLMTAGGPTWRFLISGDGGFLEFDPDDAYKLLATWQQEVDEVVFPGRLEGAFPPPGTPAATGLWPRFLAQGFLAVDPPLFVGDAAHHPLKGDRVLHARTNRLYGSTATRGDAWQVEPAGRGIELQLAVPPNTVAVLRVLPSTAGGRLGLPPQVALASTGAQPTTLGLRSLLPGPYALQDGQQLNLQVTMTPGGAVAVPAITFNRPPDKHGVPWSAAEVAGAIAGPGLLTALPCFWARPNAVEVTTTDTGAAARITLGGAALQPPAVGGLSPLGQRARTISGAANRPATVTLVAPNVGIDTSASMAPHAGAGLTIVIGAGSAKTVTFDDATFADLAWIHAGELQHAIRSALDGADATVTAVNVAKTLLFQDTGGAGLTLGGSAASVIAAGAPPGVGLNLVGLASPPGAFAFAYAWAVLGNTFNLAPIGGVAQALTINDGAARPTLTFNQAENDLRAITAEELQALVQNHFTANGVQATCDVQYFPGTGFPSEIAYARAKPDTAWVGSTDGTLYKTANDGGRWNTIEDPLLVGLDRAVEAIAIHPVDADTVYVGLEGRPTSGPEDNTPLTKPGLIFKTTDGGSSWSHVGADVKSTDGGLLGAYALTIDTGAPETVFAATEVGVFRTTNGGSSWQPFNEGLPVGLVRDLDFVPDRRVLRAGIWGRGTYERRVGDATAKDVQLYVRTSELDDGSVRPAPRGPDLRAAQPRTVTATTSPDIKVSRDIPPSLAGLITLDGAAFDLDVEHEQIVSGGSAVYVQLHNRGAFAGTDLRVVCLWADASAGLPRLPDDFWTTFRAGALPVTAGDWTLVHDSKRPDAVAVVPEIGSGRPVVQRLPVTWPNDIATHHRIGILLLVECAEDQLSSTALDLDELLATETKAAYRETGTVRDHDDNTILIRRTRAAQFTVSAPPAPLVAATAILRAPALPVGPIGSLLGGTQLNFSLPPVGANVRALTFSTPAQVVTITFGTGIANPAAATQQEVLNVITRALVAAGAPLAVNSAGNQIQLRCGAGSSFQVTGGTAAPNLGLVAGPPVAVLATGPAPFNLSAGAPQTLTLSVTNRAVVHFARQPDFDPTTPQPARAVRRVLNRGFAAANLPLRAVVPRVDLWIRRSITDIDGLPSPVAGHGLADIVASPAAVALAAQAALYDLVKVHGPDPVHAAVDNFLYVRVSNLGNADLAAPDSRHRLYVVAMAASPITLTQIGAVAGIQQAVSAGSSTIVELHWNPGAASVGDRLFVLAVSDDATNNALAKDGAAFDASATFATVDELDRFCAANPGAAYRMFVVGA